MILFEVLLFALLQATRRGMEYGLMGIKKLDKIKNSGCEG